MLKRFDPLLFFIGSRTVRAAAQYRTALLDVCLREGINYSGFRCEEDGSIIFCASFGAVRRLQKRCEAEGIAIEITESRGLPHFLYRHRHRAGLFLGTLIACALTVLSSRFVWHVQVVGNLELSEADIVEELRACGFGVGSYIPKVETAKLENRLLLASERISWVSVYIDGTVARVQVIEYRETPPEEAVTRPANLVAAADGQIETVELLRGNCVVTPGQAVKKGELLVSGIYDSNIVGYRFTRAAGRVLARTEHTFTVEIPLQDTQKIYEEPFCNQIFLNFFDFSLKIFKSTGNLPLTCDIIEEERSPLMWGRYPLPLSLSVTTVKPYTEQGFTRTPEEALELAYAELESRLMSLSDDAQLLRKDVTATITETSLILNCTVLCIENIAVQYEFEITE